MNFAVELLILTGRRERTRHYVIAERIVEMLESKYGGEQMKAIELDIKHNGIRSSFYTETKSFYDYFRREASPHHTLEALLRKTWQGRG